MSSKRTLPETSFPGTNAVTEATIGGMHCITVEPIRGTNGYPHTILHIHGAWCSGVTMFPIADQLCARGFRCVCMSLPGHGETPLETGKPFGQTSMDVYIDAACGVLKELGSAAIVGHSMGALIGSQVALKASGRTKAFVSLMSGPPRWTLLGLEAIFISAQHIPDIMRCKPVLLSRLNALLLAFNTIESEKFAEEYEKLIPESGRALREMLLWKYAVRPLNCPSLVIMGSDDTMAPNQKGIYRKLGKKSQFLMIKSCHMCMFMFSAPREIAVRVSDFLCK
ncbi:MAG: alpha/beta fold hydrolase [Candidatus Taylorbacteria bacterium]|nr:alpha/beta fold hydrolase [Candidatus Taylorbacteria bacterium]